MGEAKNRKKIAAESANEPTTKILGWEITEAYKKKLIAWTIEGVLISVFSLGLLWVMFLFNPDV